MENGVVEVTRRDTGEKNSVPVDELHTYVQSTLYTMQNDLLENSQKLREDNTFVVDSWEVFKEKIEE